MKLLAAFFALLALSCAAQNSTWRPVAFLHGLDGTCGPNPWIGQQIQKDFPGIYFKSIALDGCDSRWNSFFIPMNLQVELLYKAVMADPVLRNGGFTLMGHSQGGITTRAFIQRYGHMLPKPIHNYISLAGVQGGVSGVPDVNDWCQPSASFCDLLINLMDKVAESGGICDIVSFCQYWVETGASNAKDVFCSKNDYLSDISGWCSTNSTYKKNWIGITGKAVFLRALQDHIVVPSQSEHFAHYAWGDSTYKLVPLNQTDVWTEDRLGLRTLHEQSRFFLEDCECTHQNMPEEKCMTTVYEPFVKPYIS
jgi:palmitoyl-protein thioesterase